MSKKESMKFRIFNVKKSIVAIIFLIAFSVISISAKENIEQYTFDELVELLNKNQKDSVVKSVLKNRNYKFKYDKKNRFWTSEKKGVRIGVNSSKRVIKVEFSFRSFGEKYSGDLPKESNEKTLMENFDWYKDSKTKYHTKYENNLLFTLNVMYGNDNNTLLKHLTVEKSYEEWVNRPPMQNFAVDDRNPADIEGDFEGDKILDYIGRHINDPVLDDLLKYSPLEFTQNRSGTYTNKKRNVYIFFSKEMFVNEIRIDKGFENLVPGNIKFENLLSNKNWDYPNTYNSYDIKYKNYLFSIKKFPNNAIRWLKITPTEFTKKKGEAIVLVSKFESIKLEGDVFLQLLGLSIKSKFVEYLLEKYNFTKNGETYYKSESLGVSIFVRRKSKAIKEISANNSDGAYFKGTLPYNLTFDSFLDGSDLEFRKTDYAYEAFKDGFKTYVASDDGKNVEFIAFSDNYNPLASDRISHSIDEKEYKNKKIEGDLLLNLIGESVYDNFVDFLFDEYKFEKGIAHGFEEVNDQYDSESLGLSFLTSKKTKVIERIVIKNTEEGKFVGKLPFDIKMDSFLSNTSVNFQKINDIYGAKKYGYLFLVNSNDGKKADQLLFQSIVESDKPNTVAENLDSDSNSKNTTPQNIDHLIREFASSLNVEGWYLVTKKIDSSIKGVNNYYSSVEFGSWSNNLYIIQIIYLRESVSVKKLKVNDVVINMESKSTVEGYQVELYPVNSSNDGKVKVSANLSFKDSEESDYAIVVYRKPVY